MKSFKRMRHFVAAAACAFLVTTLSACASNSTSVDNANAEAAEPATTVNSANEAATAAVTAQTAAPEAAQAENTTAGSTQSEDPAAAQTTVPDDATTEQTAQNGDTTANAAEQPAEDAATQATDPETGIPVSDTDADTTYGSDALMQVVMIGDSQFGNFNGTNGVAYQLSRYCHANVYNMAIGGTCAALLPNDSNDTSAWDSQSGIGMANLFAGSISTDFLNFPEYQYQLSVYNHCDLSKTDVFVVEYGVNDFMAKIPLDKELAVDQRSYRGALNYIIMQLNNHYPNAKIVICAPIYTQFFQNGTYIGDSNTVNYGYGTLYDYVKAAVNIVQSSSNSNLSAMNPYVDLGITAENAYDNLIDGIHMNDSMRVKYSQMLSRVVIRSLGYQIDQGVDPSTVEWWTTKQ